MVDWWAMWLVTDQVLLPGLGTGIVRLFFLSIYCTFCTIIWFFYWSFKCSILLSRINAKARRCWNVTRHAWLPKNDKKRNKKPKSWTITMAHPAAYAGFWKGGGEAGTLKNLRRTKIRIKTCSTQNQSDFVPEIRWRAKKKKSSLKFSPIICTKSGAGQKQTSSPTFWVLKASAQLTKGKVKPQFCILSMLIILSWRPKGGGHGPMPPLNTPLDTSKYCCDIL